MPDLTIINCYTCSSNIQWNTDVQSTDGKKRYTITYDKRGWTCTCPSYRFRGAVECKHIQQAQKERCGWNWEAWCGSPGEPTKDNKCPNCGGEVSIIKVGV